MKLLVLAGSVALNVALVGAVLVQPQLAPPACRDFVRRHSPFTAAAPAVAAPAPRAAGPTARPKLWSLLDTHGDLSALIARLRAAGFPADVIREMVRTEVDNRYQARYRAITATDGSVPYWKPQGGALGLDPKRLSDYAALQRDRATQLRELLKDPFFASDDVTAAQRRQFGNLSRQKIDQLQRIEDDYNEMTAAIRGAARGILLPEDREKLALLDREKRADLAAALTPEELADYQVRSSPLTAMLSRNLGNFNATEPEFRAIFQAESAYSDKLSAGFNISAGMISSMGVQFQDRQAAQQQLADTLKAGLGPARYADYVRETDPNYQTLARLAQRANLAPETVTQAFGVRETVAQQSAQIANDPAFDANAKLTALQTLAQSTRSQLLALLGPIAGPAYVTSVDAQWLKQVERGNSVSFTGGPSMSISLGGATSTPVLAAFGTSPVFKPVAPPPAPPRP